MSKSVPASYFQDETQNLREANRRGVAFAEARQQSEKQHRSKGVCGGSFVVKSPLSTGVLLVDKVGLRKIIEAGLFLVQCWTGLFVD